MTSEESHGPSLSAEFVENLRELFPEHGDLSHEELLREQECLLQSLQISVRTGGGTPDSGQISDLSAFSGQEFESLRSTSLESQLDLDEAVARSLEELDDDFDEPESFGHTADSSREIPVSPSETPVTARSSDVRQDEINPDDMSHEQLQSLGDSIGSEGTGLPEEFISNLRSFEYKTRKEDHRARSFEFIQRHCSLLFTLTLHNAWSTRVRPDIRIMVCDMLRELRTRGLLDHVAMYTPISH